MKPWPFTLFLLALATYGSFIWAVKYFFVVPNSGLPPRMKALAIPGAVTMAVSLVCLLWPGAVEPAQAKIAGVLFSASLLLFWWAIRINLRRPLDIAFTEAEPGHLVKEGPYRFIRHPLYTSYMVAWLATPIASSQYWLLIPAVGFAILYYRAATLEERFFSKSIHASAYLTYQKRTGMFLPKLFRF